MWSLFVPGLSSDISSSELDSVVLPLHHGMLPKNIKVLINGIDDSVLKISSEAELKYYIYQTIQDKELAYIILCATKAFVVINTSDIIV